MRKPLASLSIVFLTGLALGGCGDDGGETPSAGEPATETPAPAGGGGVDIVAHDISFDEDAYEATAGTVEVSYLNEGNIPHTLVIEGIDGFKLEVTGNGDEDQGTVELDAGTYTLFCDVAGHRAAGMEATLEVA